MMTAPPAAQFEFVSDLTGFRAPNWLIVRLTGRLRRKHDLFRALAAGLKFPAYFGDNWDALEECLRDLAWLRAKKGVVLLHEQVPLADDDQRQTYFQILQSAQRAGAVPLRVVFPQHAGVHLDG